MAFLVTETFLWALSFIRTLIVIFGRGSGCSAINSCFLSSHDPCRMPSVCPYSQVSLGDVTVEINETSSCLERGASSWIAAVLEGVRTI